MIKNLGFSKIRLYLCSQLAKNMILPDIDTFYLHVSELIKTERLKKDIKQHQLCDLLDLSRGSITNLEKGKHRPSIYQLLKLAVFFGIEYTQLIPVELEKKETSENETTGLPSNTIIGEGDINVSDEKSITKFISDVKGGKK
jgi:transcriptional regulator with XRE-family HTH domain